MSSFSLFEFQRETQERNAFTKALTDQYPDAVMTGDRWYSCKLRPEDCDVITLDGSPEHVPSRSTLLLLIGKQIDHGVIYVHPHGPHRYEKVFPMFCSEDFQQRLRDALLEWATGIKKVTP